MKKNQTKKQEQEVVVFGNTILKNTINKKLIYFIKIMMIERFMNQKSWKIERKMYQKEKWPQIFFNMVQTSIEGINFFLNDSPDIPKQISNVRYTNLTILYLWYNQILNIQALAFINCQNLTNLTLHDSNISNIKCLNKLSMPVLRCFQIFGNPISEINKLNRTKTNPNIFQDFALQYQQLEEYIFPQDLSIIFQLNFQKLKVLYIAQTPLRIKQKKIQKQKMLEKGLKRLQHFLYMIDQKITQIDRFAY